MLSAARLLDSAGSLCSNGVAQAVPDVSPLPPVSRSHCRSNVCRSPTPRSRLPVWVPSHRPRRVKAAQVVGCSEVGALVLALTGVVHLLPHTGGSFTSPHLACSFPVLALDIEGLSSHLVMPVLCRDRGGWGRLGAPCGCPSLSHPLPPSLQYSISGLKTYQHKPPAPKQYRADNKS